MSSKNKKGFTLIEIVIAIGLATALIALVMQMFSLLRGDVARGTVDLQNLQDARLVINSLRRDFSCSIPIYGTDSIDKKDEIRADPIWNISEWNPPSAGVDASKPVLYSGTDIQFCKKDIEADGSVKIETIQYSFDPTSKTLNRISSPSGERRTFKGIASIKFDLYYHPLKEDIPMLLVSMNIQTTESNQTKVLPLTTTISSNIITTDVENLDWNWSGN